MKDLFGSNNTSSYICSVMNGKELKILRKKNNLTQKEVSEAIGTNVARISEWEREKFKISSSYQRLLEMFFKQ